MRNFLKNYLSYLHSYVDRAPEEDWALYSSTISKIKCKPEYLRLSGWVFHSKFPVVLELRLGTMVLSRHVPSLSRTDVAAQYPSLKRACHSGFLLHLPTSLFPLLDGGELTLQAHCILSESSSREEKILWRSQKLSKADGLAEEKEKILNQYYPKRLQQADGTEAILSFYNSTRGTKSSVFGFPSEESPYMLVGLGSDVSHMLQECMASLKGRGANPGVFSLERESEMPLFVKQLQEQSEISQEVCQYLIAVNWQSLRMAFLLRGYFKNASVLLYLSQSPEEIMRKCEPEEIRLYEFAMKSLCIPLFQTQRIQEAFLQRYDFICNGIVLDDNEDIQARMKQARLELYENLEKYSRASRNLTVIIPVYNALSSAIRAIRSVMNSLPAHAQCIVVDDASDVTVREALRNKIAEYSPNDIKLIVREHNGGFLEACLSGLQSCANTHDILLMNSDVVVSSDSVKRLLEDTRVRPAIGMASTLSTGSYQFQYSIPCGLSYALTSNSLSHAEHENCPVVFCPEGQFLFLKRWAIDRLGFFDRVYERGFCEESDLAMRYYLHGIETVCAKNTLVFHEQSASFQIAGRELALQRNQPLLEKRWGAYLAAARSLQSAVQDSTNGIEYDSFKPSILLSSLSAHKVFDEQSAEIYDDSKTRDLTNIYSDLEELLDKVEVVFILPALSLGGGALSVLQHVNELQMRGIEARVFTLSPNTNINYPLLAPAVSISHENLFKLPWKKQKVVATFWSTAYLVHSLTEAFPDISGSYYVQDYEPWFYDANENSKLIEYAKKSYSLGLPLVSKTRFLKSLVEDKHNCPVHLITPGIDRTIFYSGDQERRIGRPKLVAMYRPSTPRRGSVEMVSVLEALLRRLPELDVTLFGSDEPIQLADDFHVRQLGRVSPLTVSQLYQAADITLDLSHWQGFGRMGIEAMSCGVVPVLSDSGGVSEYALHEKNCLMFDGSNPSLAVEHIIRLSLDRELRMKLRRAALETAESYSEAKASDDWLAIFQNFTDEVLLKSGGHSG